MSRSIRLVLVACAIAGFASPAFAGGGDPPCSVRWEPWLATTGALPPATIYRPSMVC